MPVVSDTPATWRGRAPETLAARLGLTARSVGFYRRLCTQRVLDGIRALGKRWQSRLDKARSATQTPSGFERLLEDLVVMKVAGAEPAQLREAAVELNRVVSDLDDRPATQARVLAAILQADARASEEHRAQTLMLTREHRRLDEPDLDRLIDATTAAIAASTEQLEALSAFRREKALARHHLVAIPGGRA